MENYIMRIDDNGTKYYQHNESLKIFFECQYCNALFETKRRFNQKFCSNSCRTMASRQRNGLGIVSYKDRDKTTNTGILNAIQNSELNFEKKLDKITHENAIKNTKLEIEIKKLQSNVSTSNWMNGFTLLSNLITLYQTFEIKSKLNEDTSQLKVGMNMLVTEIKKEAENNEEIRAYISKNEAISKIFQSL